MVLFVQLLVSNKKNKIVCNDSPYTQSFAYNDLIG